jgi:hypothetical protein
MKRFSSIEIGALILGILFFLVGLDAVIWPQSGVVPHFTNDVWGMSPKTDMEVVSTTGARVYGVLAMLFGAGIAAMAICREKK